MRDFVRFSVRLAAVGGCLLASGTKANASPHWAYCTVNNVSEVWVSPVLTRDGAGGIAQVKAEFVRKVTDEYPGLHPRVYQSATCFGDGPDYEGYDQTQMLQMRNREMKQFSSIHEVHMGPEPKIKGKGKGSK